MYRQISLRKFAAARSAALANARSSTMCASRAVIASMKSGPALAEVGDATSQYNLGYCCYRGEGMPQDYAAAARWFRKAAEQGDTDAKEAISFAILAGATIRGISNNVPTATGAKTPVVLGKIIPGKI